MASNDRSAKSANLRAQQKRLNFAIDNLINLSENRASQSDIDAAQRRVSSISSSIAFSTKDEFQELIALAVRPLINVAIRIALDLDLFKIITSAPTSVEAIASAASCDPVLIIRITRSLAASHILNEVGPGLYAATPFSNLLTDPIMAAWFKLNHDISIPRNYKIPAYLAKLHHQKPVDIDDFNSETFGGESNWDQISSKPEQLTTFQTGMKLADIRPPATVAVYDFSSNLGETPASGIILVDVGGGHGHALEAIISNNPSLPGRFILQDLPSTIAQLKAETSRHLKFEPMAHDFFTPQPPSMRPRWFYLRSVLHDWSDKSCLQILGHLRDAIVGQSNSTILLAEVVLPDQGAVEFDTLQDINMMQLGGMERSESQWQDLLVKAGLEIIGVTRPKAGNRCILEVGIKSQGAQNSKL